VITRVWLQGKSRRSVAPQRTIAYPRAVIYRRDYRLRAHTLVPLPFFAGAAVRIVQSGGITALERGLLLVTGGLYLLAALLVWTLEARRRLVTDDTGLRRFGWYEASHIAMGWTDVTEVRERYRPRTSRLRALVSFQGALELSDATGRTVRCDGGWRPYPDLVRECAERTTESILASCEAQRAAGVVLSFGDVRVDGDALLFPLSRGGVKRVRFTEVTGLRLHQGVLVFYLGPERWILRPLSRLTNPYVLMELVLRGGAGRSPGPPPASAEIGELDP
jgi:hypothetical protein